jgi:hypothetical protein
MCAGRQPQQWFMAPATVPSPIAVAAIAGSG